MTGSGCALIDLQSARQDDPEFVDFKPQPVFPRLAVLIQKTVFDKGFGKSVNRPLRKFHHSADFRYAQDRPAVGKQREHFQGTFN